MNFNASLRDFENPYAIYQVMREDDPLNYSEEDKIWYTFNYELADFFFRSRQCLHHSSSIETKKEKARERISSFGIRGVKKLTFCTD